ncbi:MAG: hypothetical protein D3904_05905 [Candidatus Electrothrix sp. EH2]|nr:hypothetical protein [Candidatus Electrothrix sp. EH2]
MNIRTKFLRHCTSEKTMSGTLVALPVMFISLFCADIAPVNGHERHGRHKSEVKMYGVIDSMPNSGLTGKWVVGGREVEVTDRTEIEEEHGRARAGMPVEIEGYRDNNRFVADEIEVERRREYRSY